MNVQLFNKNTFGDSFFHIAIRHGNINVLKRVLQYMDTKKDFIDVATDASQYPLDLENTQEKCTPYMLAVLREDFEIA